MRGFDPLRMLIIVSVLGALSVHFYFRVTGDPRERDRPSGAGTISGRVTDDLGAPVEGAGVVVSAAIDGDTERWTTSTNLDGSFDVNGLPAGRHYLAVRKGGYTSGRFSVGEAAWLATPIDLIDLDDGGGMEMAEADVTLPRSAIITGTVVDAVGNPLAGGLVRVIRVAPDSQWLLGTPAPATLNGIDAEGRFIVSGLDAGAYLLVARRTGDTGPRVYFPGVSRISEARTIVVDPGQRLDIRIQRRPFSTTSATVSAPFDDDMLRNMSLHVYDADSPWRRRSDAATVSRQDDGTFAIEDLPAGRFHVFAAFRVPPRDRISTERLIVSDGVTPLSLELPWPDGVDLSGRLNDASGLNAPERPAPGYLRLNPRGSQGPSRTIRVADDGSFTATRIAPGEYSLAASFDFAVSGVENAGRTRPGSLLSVGTEALGGIVVHLAGPALGLEIDVFDPDDRPTSDAIVAVFPADVGQWSADNPVRFTRPSTTGRASLDSVPPGDYRVAALRTLDPGWRLNPADPSLAPLVTPRSVPVTLETGQRAEITVIVR